ncbi:hypothetical protein BASA83_013818 [Batrachochytrium salamandrivorans]|nr:hypothetical protein BASA83_013818 [Batrachochytrium salamandrivorans]
MEAAEHGIPSSYSCLSQGIVHILICSSSGRITVIGPIPVQRGVRQGCPLSGRCSICSSTTFSMVSHPSQSLDYRETPTPSEDSLGMQFGVAKCGIISFTGHLAPRLDNPLDIRLHGQLVSRVESYKYLGVLIDSKLDHSAWLKQKRSALEHTISALHPVLANHQLTVNYRSRIFSAVVMGKAYYGRAGWWQQVTPCTTARQSTRVSDCSLVPDSRLPLDPSG